MEDLIQNLSQSNETKNRRKKSIILIEMTWCLTMSTKWRVDVCGSYKGPKWANSAFFLDKTVLPSLRPIDTALGRGPWLRAEVLRWLCRPCFWPVKISGKKNSGNENGLGRSLPISPCYRPADLGLDIFICASHPNKRSRPIFTYHGKSDGLCHMVYAVFRKTPRRRSEGTSLILRVNTHNWTIHGGKKGKVMSCYFPLDWSCEQRPRKFDLERRMCHLFSIPSSFFGSSSIGSAGVHSPIWHSMSTVHGKAWENIKTYLTRFRSFADVVNCWASQLSVKRRRGHETED